MNDCFDTTVRTTVKLKSWKTWEGDEKGHGNSWNFKSFKKYKP